MTADAHSSLPGEPLLPRSAVVTVGTFDGVHRGHAAVLRRLVEVARELRRTAVIVTFDPHPLRIVRPESAPRLLTSTTERVALLRASGADRVAVVPFTPGLARFTPEQFVEEVLLAHFGLDHLVIGYDHGFGRDRSGDADTLRALGAQRGFGVTVVEPTVTHEAPISSTRIRATLEAGRVVEAAQLLGRPYGFHGTVIRGEGRGRALGFPTANLQLDDPFKLLPAEGIYAARAALPDRSEPIGALHIGPRPTFDGAPPSVELHLLAYEGDLYGQAIEVRICEWLRPILTYTTAAALSEAIREDCERTESIMAAGAGACRGGENQLA